MLTLRGWQVTNTGVVTGGVGAVATSGPTSAAANASAAPSPSTSQKPSSAGRIAVSGGLGLIAAAVAFGVLA